MSTHFKYISTPTCQLHRYTLSGGATVHTPLPPSAWNNVTSNTDNFTHFEIYPHGTTLKSNVQWSITNSSLATLRQEGINPLHQINSTKKSGILRVLDWGCGRGQTLLELYQRLAETSKLPSVELWGLSNIFYPEWSKLPPGINLIYDDGGNLGRYFTDNKLDIVYSYWGLLHLGTKSLSIVTRIFYGLLESSSTNNVIETQKTHHPSHFQFPLFSEKPMQILGFQAHAGRSKKSVQLSILPEFAHHSYESYKSTAIPKLLLQRILFQTKTFWRRKPTQPDIEQT